MLAVYVEELGKDQRDSSIHLVALCLGMGEGSCGIDGSGLVRVSDPGIDSGAPQSVTGGWEEGCI